MQYIWSATDVLKLWAVTPGFAHLNAHLFGASLKVVALKKQKNNTSFITPNTYTCFELVSYR